MTEDKKHHEHEDAAIAELKEEVAVLEEEVEILEEIIDLEEWAKAGKKPKKAKRYRIRIDKDYYVVEVHSMTGHALAEKTPKTPCSRRNSGAVGWSPSKPTRWSSFMSTISSGFKLSRVTPRRAETACADNFSSVKKTWRGSPHAGFHGKPS
jgi:hypothetical protein